MSARPSNTERAQVELTPAQIARTLRALSHVGPGLNVRITDHPKGIVIETSDTRQRWTIGPRGGSF